MKSILMFSHWSSVAFYGCKCFRQNSSIKAWCMFLKLCVSVLFSSISVKSTKEVQEVMIMITCLMFWYTGLYFCVLFIYFRVVYRLCIRSTQCWEVTEGHRWVHEDPWSRQRGGKKIGRSFSWQLQLSKHDQKCIWLHANLNTGIIWVILCNTSKHLP